MNAQASDPKIYEFAFPQLDTLALVENQRDEVIIHLTRDTFSETRRSCFVHELAAEGFIPDGYLWSSSSLSISSARVSWKIDHSWLKPNPLIIAKTRRFMVRLLAGALVLWLVLMTALFLTAGRPDLSKSNPQPNFGIYHG